MKTIFICIDWFSPAYKAGGPIASIVNLVENFNEDVQYYIFCSSEDLDNKKLSGVKTDVWLEFNEYTKVWYCSRKKRSHFVLRKEIKKLCPSLIYINGIYSWYFNLMPLLLSGNTRKIISPRGMLHPGALSQKRGKKRIYLFLFRIFRIHRRCSFHASGHEEVGYIQNVFGKEAEVFVAENFPRQYKKQMIPEKHSGSLLMTSISLISPMKNHLNVLQALRNSDEQITYNIFGPVKDRKYWEQCLSEIDDLPVNVSVRYHLDIRPSEVESTLANSHVFIQPSKSENFGHSIYEALSTGRPVITSLATPWNNLRNSFAGVNVSPDNIPELCNAIRFFASLDNMELEKWSIGASEYSMKAINFDQIKGKYKKMFFI